ncbi:hypothetical protein [Radiobacillus sp. PE A8.2]|uniref:hypothetical protein n=1 Tax=Radiobacillus sp. PE A8.2 TaxID=3380349 RepID=UPI00388E1672
MLQNILLTCWIAFCLYVQPVNEPLPNDAPITPIEILETPITYFSDPGYGDIG